MLSKKKLNHAWETDGNKLLEDLMANKIFPNKILSWNFKIEFCFNGGLARKFLFSTGILSLQGWTTTMWQGVTIKRSTIRLKHTVSLENPTVKKYLLILYLQSLRS